MNSPENAAVFRLADQSDSKKAKWLARTANWRSRVQSGVKGRGAEAAVGDDIGMYRYVKDFIKLFNRQKQPARSQFPRNVSLCGGCRV